MNDRTSVLIVGAGPCGLAAAVELRRHGAGVTVLDAALRRGAGSRAIMLWPPTLRLLDDLGLLDQARRRGLRPRAFSYHTGSGRPVRVRLPDPHAPLLIPQQQTTELLESALERLGGRVEWGAAATEVADSGETVRVSVERSGGRVDTIEADWLIAADGAHSTVRGRLDVDFAGNQPAQHFVLAEAPVEGPLDRGDVHYYLSPTGVALLAPMPSGEVRFSSVIPAGEQPTEQLAHALLDQRGPGGLRFGTASMITSFTSEERIAGAMRVGRCFLIGDAAHVHSAIGGQGLNLGVQDARNLAWKLAGVTQDRLAPAVLGSYDPERRAAAEETVRVTRRMAGNAAAGPLARRMRNASLRIAHLLGVLEKVSIPTLAGARVRYPNVLLGGEPPSRRAAGRQRLPAAGEQAPEWLAGLDRPQPWSFLLATTGPDSADLVTAADELAGRLPQLARGHVPHPKSGFVLVRPDGFVAASGDVVALRRVADRLAAILLPDRDRAAADAETG